MTQPSFQPPNYPPGVPYEPLPMQPPRPTALTVVAVIGIVIASLGLICNGINGIFSAVAAVGANPMAANQPQLPRWISATTSVEAFLSLFIDIAWIAVCIGLLRVSPWARKAAVNLASVHVVWLLISAGFNLGVLAPTMKQAMEQMQPPPNAPANAQAFQRGIAAGAAYGGPVLGLLFGLILPVMMLATMTRQSMKAVFAASATP